MPASVANSKQGRDVASSTSNCLGLLPERPSTHLQLGCLRESLLHESRPQLKFMPLAQSQESLTILSLRPLGNDQDGRY